MKIIKKLSEKKWILLTAACAVVFLLLCVRFYQNNVKCLRNFSGYNETVVGECVENTTILQTIKMPPTATKITLLLATYQRELEGQIKIQLIDGQTKALIQEWNILNETIADNQYYALELKDGFYRGNSDDTYAIVVTGNSSCKAGSSPTIWQSSVNTYPDGDLYINGEKNEGDLCFEIFYRSPVFARIFTVIVVLLLFLLITSQYWFAKFGNRMEIVFAVYVLILGMAYMLILPAESAPDEDRHILTAYNLSNVILGGPAAEEGLVYFREKDLSGLYGEIPNSGTYLSFYENFFSDSQSKEYVLLTEDFIIQAPFWTYLPQALGISVGRILDCNGTITILLGRVFSLFFFVGITCLSIKIIPFGKMILFAVSLLPMTLELVASYSYDTMILSLAFLFTALMCRLIFTKEVLEIKDIIAPTVVLSLLAPNKYVYIPLVLLVLLLPGEKYREKKRKWISAGIMCSAMLLVLLVQRAGGQRIYVPGFTQTEYRTLEYCLHHLPEVIQVYLNTVLGRMGYYVSSMVGMSLGWLELNMPLEVFILSIVLLLISTIETASENTAVIKNRQYVVFFVCFLGVFFATLTAMLLTWTPSTSYYIEGVQGRYFLPVLPLLLFCVKKMDIRSGKSMLKPVVYGGFIINSICLLHCFIIILGR